MLTSSAAGGQPTGRPRGEIGIGTRGLSNRLGLLAIVLVDLAVELDNARVDLIGLGIDEAIDRGLDVNGITFEDGFGGVGAIGDKVFDG